MRNTASLRAVLAAFLAEPDAPRYGYELVKLTGYKSGTVNPMLDRLEAEGFISREWEDMNPVQYGRPPRKFSRLTEEGVQLARRVLSAWADQLPEKGRV